jgi:hypothetical protein
MIKINLKSTLCAMLILGSTIEIKPMLRFITLQNLKKASVASPFIALAGITTQIGISIAQLKKVHRLRDRCRRSEKNTPEALQKDENRTFSHSSHTPKTFFSKQLLIECMKNKDENLQNYLHCEDLVQKLYAKEPNKK